jgi:GTP-binding protein
VLKKYGVDEKYISYGNEERRNPHFIMPISAVARINIQPLVYALADVMEKRQ